MHNEEFVLTDKPKKKVVIKEPVQLECLRCGEKKATKQPGVELWPMMRYHCVACEYIFNRQEEV